MKLWLLEPIPDEHGDWYTGPWEPRYDVSRGFVVRAATEEGARLFASEYAGDEKAAAWLDPALSSCTVLTEQGEAGVILQDFNAG